MKWIAYGYGDLTIKEVHDISKGLIDLTNQAEAGEIDDMDLYDDKNDCIYISNSIKKGREQKEHLDRIRKICKLPDNHKFMLIIKYGYCYCD
jgi:hypothetical protein